MTQTPEKINIAALLQDRIFILPGRPAKEDVLKRLTQAVCRTAEALDAQTVWEQIVQRERGLGTTLDTGLSIPHVRLEELEEFKAALAVLPQGIQDGAGRTETKAVFLFLSPARPVYFQKHLQLLACLAETFSPTFLAGLSRCAHAAEAAALLRGSGQAK